MSHRPPIVYPPHGIIIADSGKKGREEYANLAYKSAMACGGKVMRLNTSTCKNASEAWNMAHDRAKWEGWAWWMPLGDDDLVMPDAVHRNPQAIEIASYLTIARQSCEAVGHGAHLPFPVLHQFQGFRRR